MGPRKRVTTIVEKIPTIKLIELDKSLDRYLLFKESSDLVQEKVQLVVIFLFKLILTVISLL